MPEFRQYMANLDLFLRFVEAGDKEAIRLLSVSRNFLSALDMLEKYSPRTYGIFKNLALRAWRR